MEVRPNLPDLEPAGEDDSILVGMFFDKATKLYPDWSLGDRTDLAMAMFATVKKWAHNLELTTDSSESVTLD